MVTEKKIKPILKSLVCVLVPVICSIIFMIFCSLHLTGSVWFDESYSAYIIRGDFSDIWSLTAADVHPPFFYFCLKIWTTIFGHADFAMRFMSIFFGALTIIVVFQLLKRWFGIKVATISTFFLSLSPMFIRYGQEMRMYTLVFLIVASATYALDLALKTKKTRYYILYALLICLGMWTHYFTALAWISHIIYYTITKQAKFYDKKWLLTYLLAIVLFLPWIPSFFSQISAVQKGFWIPDVSIITPVEYLSQSLFFTNAENAAGWLVVLFFIVVALAIYLGKKVYNSFTKSKRVGFMSLLILIAVPPCILIVFSLPPLTSVFVDRYIMYSAALIWALIGIIIAYAFSKKVSGSKKMRLIAPAILTLSMLGTAAIGIYNVEHHVPEGNIKDIVSAVQLVAEPGEPILANDEWNYYDAVFYTSEEHPVYFPEAWSTLDYGSMLPLKNLRYNVIDDLGEFTNTFDRFWLITNTVEDGESYDLKIDGYRVVSEIINDHHAAFKLEKN